MYEYLITDSGGDGMAVDECFVSSNYPHQEKASFENSGTVMFVIAIYCFHASDVRSPHGSTDFRAKSLADEVRPPPVVITSLALYPLLFNDGFFHPPPPTATLTPWTVPFHS
ncbi:hypothetical protein TSMEX_009124 [Taenia solium]|eukprot:TsM_000444000 transcript=TsM_000444000 gene=TsM_000444000